MRGEESTLEKFFYSTEPIIIPVYQRNYTWKKENCKLLFEDILNVSNKKDRTHFIGSIVHVKHSDANIIIDGQQRITSISILLLALRNAIMHGNIQTDNDMLIQEIEEKFLINKFSKQKDRRMKLKPFRDDCKAFDALFGDNDNFIENSLITKNYHYFYKEIIDRNIDPQVIFETIKRKLEFVCITLEPKHGDNPQQIFETINSTGVSLNETDKIRNFVLMNLDVDRQEKYYNDYWFPIEKNTNIFLEDFMRDYLTMIRKSIPNKSDVYKIFKEYVFEKYYDNIEPLLCDLKHYSFIFKSIKECNVGSDKANRIMLNLEHLELTTPYPFLFAMLNCYHQGEINELEMERVLEVLEVFLFRRIMSGYYNTGLNKIFANMHNRILKGMYGDYTYSDVFIYLLQHGISYWDFPNDENFKRSFAEREVYKMRSNYRLYLFYKFEEAMNKEAAGTKEKIEKGILSIEHIMPQTLSEVWRKELGDSFNSESYQKWVHNIGNLTLTAYNSEYSNRSFLEKRDGIQSIPSMKGFKYSCIAMNKYVSEQDCWTFEQIENRCKMFAIEACKIWPYPISTYTPKIIEEEFIPLDADYKFTGRYIKSYIFNGIVVNVNSWAEAFVRIVQTFYEIDDLILYNLVCDPSEVYYSNKPQKGFIQIAKNIYLLVQCDTNSKLRQIQRLLNMYKFESDDISVTLYPQKD